MNFISQIDFLLDTKKDLEFAQKELEAKIESVVDDGFDELRDQVVSFSSLISEKIKVPNNDQGPFDSNFCGDLEKLIKKHLTRFTKESLEGEQV